ncbi:MATE family efflux transporter [Cellulosilyticum ruminicola]|uniref:MATE family efflux transporter n=1 Tax=Cellulosilyticum ruminicola TaxID=425254 RepID=UPI0006D0B571|nr:MATE family efflux transporter [Cellulosilyticum ruminicola]
MKKVFKDKAFLSTLLMLAIPITLQSFITSSLNLVDTMMVGKLGETAISAVGLANQYMFVFTLCLMGINAGASVFMSQFWGGRDLKGIKTFLGIDLVVGLGASALFGGVAFFAPHIVMGILTSDPAVIVIGVIYLKIVAISCLFMGVTQAFSAALRSTEQTKAPMFASLIGVAVNVVLNWVLIFGKFGAPQMGVNGAAFATMIARLIEVIFIVSVVYCSKNKVAAKFNELMNFNMGTIKTYFKTSWSVIVNELIFSVGSAAYATAYAKISTDASATMQISTTIINMFFIFLTGIGFAAAIMIGNKIGAGEEDIAHQYASHVGKLTPLIGIILGIAMWFSAPSVVTLFNIKTETALAAIKVLRVMAVVMPLRTFNAIMIIGVFRGGGDTTYSMIVQAGTIWLYSVPLAFIGVLVFKLPVHIVFLLVCTEEIVKIPFELVRLKSGKWLKNVIA